MKVLAIEKEAAAATAEEFNAHAKAEAARVWELHQSGVIRELYFREDRPEAVLILECADAKEADRVLDSLPLVKAGLITFLLFRCSFTSVKVDWPNLRRFVIGVKPCDTNDQNLCTRPTRMLPPAAGAVTATPAAVDPPGVFPQNNR